MTAATILIAEDESDLRELVAFNLKKAGHRVLQARDGVEALDVLEGGPVDMVVADVMMPRMDGLELCARIRERPELADVPFLFLTAKGDAEAQYRGLRAGADDYIAKPFELPDLVARVRGRLERRERDGRPGSTRARRAPAPEETRWCPACGRRVRASVCPDDGIETLGPAALQARGAALAPGSVIGGRFRVERALGSGAMGAVHVAVQLSIGRKVALKVLHPGALRDETEIRRFHQEARVAATLDHPNVVNIVDFGVDEATGMPFIAMALLTGETLRELLARGPLWPSRALEILASVARGLAAAHAAGIVHRDLKPENVMIDAPGPDELRVTVLDFGVAKMSEHSEASMRLTGDGEIVGTPRCMSPEQVRGDAVTASSDLYGLGCLLHEMLTGQAPFRSESAARLLFEHLNAPIPPLPDPLPSGSSLPAGLAELHAGLLAKTPAERPGSAAEVAHRAEGLARGRRPSSIPPLAPDPLLDAPTASLDDDTAVDGTADTQIRDAIAEVRMRPRRLALALVLLGALLAGALAVVVLG